MRIASSVSRPHKPIAGLFTAALLRLMDLARAIMCASCGVGRPHQQSEQFRAVSCSSPSGCGATVAHVLWEYEVAGSNPATPTTQAKLRGRTDEQFALCTAVLPRQCSRATNSPRSSSVAAWVRPNTTRALPVFVSTIETGLSVPASRS